MSKRTIDKAYLRRKIVTNSLRKINDPESANRRVIRDVKKNDAQVYITFYKRNAPSIMLDIEGISENLEKALRTFAKLKGDRDGLSEFMNYDITMGRGNNKVTVKTNYVIRDVYDAAMEMTAKLAGTTADKMELELRKVAELNGKDFGTRLQKESDTRPLSEKEVAVRDAVVDTMREAGLDVITDVEEGQRVLDEENRKERLSSKQKRALETVTIADKSANNATVISSATGAKV